MSIGMNDMLHMSVRSGYQFQQALMHAMQVRCLGAMEFKVPAGTMLYSTIQYYILVYSI